MRCLNLYIGADSTREEIATIGVNTQAIVDYWKGGGTMDERMAIRAVLIKAQMGPRDKISATEEKQLTKEREKWLEKRQARMIAEETERRRRATVEALE